MANHFPVIPSMDVANLQYFVHMTPVVGNSNSTPQQALSLVNFGFTREDGQGVITFDYTGFDQDTYEAGLKTMLNGISVSGYPLRYARSRATVTGLSLSNPTARLQFTHSRPRTHLPQLVWPGQQA